MTPLDKRDLYRFPWSLNDNPIGWLEITDVCNINCKGCYRQTLAGDKPFDQICDEILFLKRWRNCDNISIAGGEPLLHPRINDIIHFVAQNGMKPMMLTNAQALTKSWLTDLKEAGLFGMTLHIDQFQQRKGWENCNELELMEYRQEIADLVAEVGGLQATFNMTVYHENFDYLPAVIRWARQNYGKVDGVVMITYRAVPELDEVQYSYQGKDVDIREITYTSARLDEIDIRVDDIYELMQKNFPDFRCAAYLGGTTLHTSYKWLVSSWLIDEEGDVQGYFGPKSLEFDTVLNHLFKGRYASYRDTQEVWPWVFGASLWDPNVRQGLKNYLKGTLFRPWKTLKPLRMQFLNMVQAPDMLEDGSADMCDSCPDMTVYGGRLVRSCRMDEIRKYGGFISASQIVAPS